MAIGAAAGLGSRSIADVRKSFFDSDVVLKSMDRTLRRNMSKLGAYVRTRARSSLRYRKAPSPPGQPPSVHKTTTRLKKNRKTGVTKRQPSSPFRDLIFFAYDKDSQSMVAGPVIFPSARKKGTPKRLEYGGTTTGKRRGVAVTLNYEPRPTMHPALEQELPKFWAGMENSMR